MIVTRCPVARQGVRFSAVLRPNRSVTPASVNRIMALVAVLWLGAAIGFAESGAWPVSAFLVAGVGVLYGALRLALKAGRTVETLALTEGALTICRVGPRGQRQDWSLPPHWLQVITDGAAAKGGIVLRTHGRSVAIGRFLAPVERETLARDLRAALRALAAPCFPAPVPAA